MRVVALVAFVLITVSCSDGAGVTTTTGTLWPTSLGTSAPTGTTSPEAESRELPEDEAVVTGVLDNGFTYYLRANDSPGGRAELRLLVDAGSVQETSDQAGMAHFLEHMMFNGTERYPRNELITVLESFGPRFGPDINAHTSYDETVYELSLSNEDELLDLGIGVLREWATRATLTVEDVEEERGVVLDEWRLRAQGFGARVNQALTDLILAGSRYEGHSPIGTEESIMSATPAVLERFYREWYRPDRMALVAVGDFDIDEMEERVVGEFDDMQTPAEDADFAPVGFQSSTTPTVARHVDEEAALAGVTVLYPFGRDPITSVDDYQSSIATALGLRILGERLDADALAADSPLLGGNQVDTHWTRAVGIRGVDVEVSAGRDEEGITSVLTELERVRREGVTDDEFERAVSAFEAASQQRYDQRASAQDVEFVAQIVSHHLEGGHLMSPGQTFEMESEIIDAMTPSVVNASLAEMIGGAPAILVLGPDDEGLTIPDADRVLEILADAGASPIVDRDDFSDPDTLMTRPEPVEPETVTVDPQFDYTTLTFSNGATVYLWESDIAANSVYARVEGFGGTSLVAVPDLPEVFLMSDIAARSGLGDLDGAALRRVLNDQIVDIGPFFTETRQGLDGTASVDDIETLFQMIHLIMTRPRLDQSAARAVLDEMETLNASRQDLPAVLFEEALNDAYYGDDARYFVLPSSAQLADFDLDVARGEYARLLSNPAAFAFVFVGEFDVDEVSTLASSYIGTLPSGQEPPGFVDYQPLPPREVQVRSVAVGAGDQGQVGMFFTNEFEPVLKDRLTARLLELILTSRLRQRVREELSATYSIVAGIDLQRDPDPFAEAFVISTGDPDGLDVIASEVVDGISLLQREGPTDAQFETAVAQMREELELLDNVTIANGLVTSHLYPDQPFIELARRYPLLETVTADDVQTLAAEVFDLGQRIEIRQGPRE